MARGRIHSGCRWISQSLEHLLSSKATGIFIFKNKLDFVVDRKFAGSWCVLLLVIEDRGGKTS